MFRFDKLLKNSIEISKKNSWIFEKQFKAWILSHVFQDRMLDI